MYHLLEYITAYGQACIIANIFIEKLVGVGDNGWYNFDSDVLDEREHQTFTCKIVFELLC